jgi:RHS repeat-associated protein
MGYDGDGLRLKKTENGAPTYYLRSSVLGGQVVAAELNSNNNTWTWARGYVYLGGQMLAVQAGGVFWVQQDPITKSQRITNSSGTVTSTIDLDPWGGETSRSSSQAFQPHRFTTYERDGNGGDEAMFRRYHGYWMRFAQPDPFDGSYDQTDPQSFNRYSYTQNDPVNLVDPSGLFDLPPPPPPSSLFGDYFLPAWMGSSSDWVGLLMPISVEGGGGPQNTPQPQKPPLDCNLLRQLIEGIYRRVSQRATDLENDPLDMVPNGHIARDNPYITIGASATD